MSYSFSINSGSGNSNYRGWNLTHPIGQNAISKRTTPDVPADNQGDFNRNALVVEEIGLDVGGYYGTPSVRFVAYSDPGTFLFRTNSRTLPNNFGTVDLPRVTLSCLSARIAAGDTVLLGGREYGFGVWSLGPVGFQKQVNSNLDVYRDGSIGSTDNMNEGWQSASDAGKSLIGRVYYYYLPSAPKDLLVNTVGSVSTLTWGAPTSDGGSSITGYSIAYKPDDSSTWAYIDTRTLSNPTTRSYAFTGLVGTYDFKVAAYNGASGPLGARYSSGTDAISKWSAEFGAQVATLGPAVRVDTDPESWVNSEINIYQTSIGWGPCDAVYVYGGTPPAWQPLRGV